MTPNAIPESFSGNGTTIEVRSRRRCPFCKSDPNKFTVGLEQYMNYLAGGLVQAAFPQLNPDAREELISGAHGQCFDKYMENSTDES